MTATPLVALVGNPNAGKSALFNALTGARQKVGNYPGVTVERHSGRLALPDGRTVDLVDLPGAYSLEPSSPDERVTRDVVTGTQAGERLPDALVVVIDASNLDNHLRFTLQLIALGLPVVVALNMFDLAERDGLTLDPKRLSEELGVPVVPTVAVRRRGLEELKVLLGGIVDVDAAIRLRPSNHAIGEDIVTLQRRARKIATAATIAEAPSRRWGHAFDSVALHPVFGLVLLFAILFVMFQAVFFAGAAPADAIAAGFDWVSGLVKASMPDSVLRSLITDGMIAGVGAVVKFLPQILIMFLFILVLEASGYMVRAAFLMDRVMASVGLSGRAFIPLLSSFACAVPGIMSTRTIEDEKDRLTTILVAPLMTCSARLPVYTLVIGALIPNTKVLPFVGLQGLVMLGLYVMGVIGAFVVALVLRSTVTKGESSGFMMEMPKYQLPRGPRSGNRAVEPRRDLPEARGHDDRVHHHRPVGVAELPQAARGQPGVAGQLFGGRAHRQRDRARVPADRVQSRHRARADPGDGRARGRCRGARYRLCHRQRERCRTRPGWRRRSTPAGACRPRFRS